MTQALDALLAAALEAAGQAESTESLDEVRIRVLGRKGELTAMLRQMGQLSPETRPAFGEALNRARDRIQLAIDERAEQLLAREKRLKLERETIDITMPGRAPLIGSPHPLTIGLRQVLEIFVNMGFSVIEGPEVETEFYNFTGLNTPDYHPARDVQDTFYINESVLLRTQTSPMQVREMERHAPPVRVVVPGKVYRRDQIDATHSPVFHQIEGLLVDKGITFADLKGALTAFAHQFYGADRKVRFRPHFFPFTEPSAEMDVSCGLCGGAGCRVCKGEGWIEILGSGMVHPNVLRMVGYDPEAVSGFAFGMGVDRIVMLKYGIDDLRLFFENDLRFLAQFK